MRQIGKLLLLTCCIWLLAGPQLLLQLGAWSWMLVSYSQQSNLERAIIETFGGDRPCEMCKFIQATDDETPATPQQKTGEGKTFKLLPTMTCDICIASGIEQIWLHITPEASHPSLHYKVPTPPPRFV